MYTRMRFVLYPSVSCKLMFWLSLRILAQNLIEVVICIQQAKPCLPGRTDHGPPASRRNPKRTIRGQDRDCSLSGRFARHRLPHSLFFLKLPQLVLWREHNSVNNITNERGCDNLAIARKSSCVLMTANSSLFNLCLRHRSPFSVLRNVVRCNGSLAIPTLHRGVSMRKTPVKTRASEAQLAAGSATAVLIGAARKAGQWSQTDIVYDSSDVPAKTLAVSFDIVQS